MTNLVNMDYEGLLKEIRCKKNPQHRIEAARILLKKYSNSDRIPYLLNVVLFDPLPDVRNQIKALLFEVYGKELDTILNIEGADGIPIEEPWIIACSLVMKDWNQTIGLTHFADIEELVRARDYDGLHDALRDPLDIQRRLCAIDALIQWHNEESNEMLARAIIHDPDENVQQKAYQALYQIAGDEKAEAILDKIGAEIIEEDEEWLLVPDYFDEYQSSLENKDQNDSLFGISKADQIRGLINLFTGEKDPKRRITIINTLARSNDFNVNNAIARVGLFDADEGVRTHAKNVLENRLGDHLDDFLEHVYAAASPFMPDPEEDSELDEVEEPVYDDFSERINNQEPAVKESSAFNPMILIAGLVILAMILFIIMK